MTKKDYELIASELKSQHELLGYNSGTIAGSDTSVYEMSCRLWAQTLQAQNPRFNKEKFLQACGIKVAVYVNSKNEVVYTD